MTDDLSPPPGWRFAATPGWSLDDPEDSDFLPDLIRVGHVLLPQRFYLAAGTPGMWWSEESHFPGLDDFIVFLHFFVRHGELRLVEIRGAGGDLAKSLDALHKAVPSRLWRQIAIREITEFLTLFDAAGGWPEEYLAPTRTDAWTHTIHEYLQERRTMPHPSRPMKRNRITDKHLREVSESYLTADGLGLPPTKAVAEQFNTSHSTAAKWVGAARRRGMLPTPELLPLVQKLRAREAELREVRADRSAVSDQAAEAREIDLVIEGIEKDIATLRKEIGQAQGSDTHKEKE